MTYENGPYETGWRGFVWKLSLHLPDRIADILADVLVWLCFPKEVDDE